MVFSKVKLTAIVVMASALGAGVWVTVDRASKRGMSDTIIGRWDKLGGEPWLLPSLDEARVVQPDRPHSFQEIHAWRQGQGAEINRTREYSLNTNKEELKEELSTLPAGGGGGLSLPSLSLPDVNGAVRPPELWHASSFDWQFYSGHSIAFDTTSVA